MSVPMYTECFITKQGCTTCGSRAVRKWRENEKMKRKWRENEEMERKCRENEEMEREIHSHSFFKKDEAP